VLPAWAAREQRERLGNGVISEHFAVMTVCTAAAMREYW